MTGRDVIELDVRLRLDPLEPAVPGDCSLTATLGGMPCIVIRDLVRVDEVALGHIVAMLLVNREADVLDEFDRNRRRDGTT